MSYRMGFKIGALIPENNHKLNLSILMTDIENNFYIMNFNKKIKFFSFGLLLELFFSDNFKW